MKKVRYVNYKANYTYSPPIQDCLINLNDIQSVKPEDVNQHRVTGPLVKITFKNGETMICEGNVEDFVE